jgi:hypothetical protein
MRSDSADIPKSRQSLNKKWGLKSRIRKLTQIRLIHQQTSFAKEVQVASKMLLPTMKNTLNSIITIHIKIAKGEG